MTVAPLDPKVHDDCAQCHGTTGTLIGSALGKTGANGCESCHGVFATKHAAVDHASQVSLATDCTDCHTGLNP